MPQIMPERKNEFGDVLRYKSGRCGKSRFVGTRVNLGKVEKRTFVGDVKSVVEAWGEWTHECDREATAQEPTPMVPAAYRVKEEEVPRKLTDEQKAEIIELIEAGDIPQKAIAEEYGVSQGTISDIKRAHREREERRAERERVRENEARLREEERKREEAEREAKRPEPIPENFLPRKREEQPAQQTWFVIASDGTKPTLFPDAETAERVAEMLRAYDPSLCVIECKVWGE